MTLKQMFVTSILDGCSEGWRRQQDMSSHRHRCSRQETENLSQTKFPLCSNNAKFIFNMKSSDKTQIWIFVTRHLFLKSNKKNNIGRFLFICEEYTKIRMMMMMMMKIHSKKKKEKSRNYLSKISIFILFSL